MANENEDAAEDIVVDEDVAADAGADKDADQGDKNKDKDQDKPQETPDQKRARLQRELKQLNKKYPVDDEDKPDKPNTKSSDLDYGQKAYLVANGIKGSEEMDLVKTFMAETGKSLDDVVESKYFQAELKAMRDDVASKDAIPNGKNRAGQSAKDSVDYWLNKGELPPADQPQLRRDVVNARIKAETTGDMFTSNPVVR